MNKITKIIGTAALLGVVLTGCSEKEEPVQTPAPSEQEENVVEEKKPTLKADFLQEGNKVTINWETNITISEENYGAEHKDGEGHAHVYVNGNKVAGLKKAEPYVVENLEPGKYIIQLQLQKNNHGDYGTFIEKEVTVE